MIIRAAGVSAYGRALGEIQSGIQSAHGNTAALTSGAVTANGAACTGEIKALAVFDKHTAALVGRTSLDRAVGHGEVSTILIHTAAAVGSITLVDVAACKCERSRGCFHSDTAAALCAAIADIAAAASGAANADLKAAVNYQDAAAVASVDAGVTKNSLTPDVHSNVVLFDFEDACTGMPAQGAAVKNDIFNGQICLCADEAFPNAFAAEHGGSCGICFFPIRLGVLELVAVLFVFVSAGRGQSYLSSCIIVDRN